MMNIWPTRFIQIWIISWYIGGCCTHRNVYLALLHVSQLARAY